MAVKYSDLKRAAIRIAEQLPWGCGPEEVVCRLCGRGVQIADRMGQPDRKAHEPSCEWIALRDALGLKVID